MGILTRLFGCKESQEELVGGDDEIRCPMCSSRLGVRKELLARGRRITQKLKAQYRRKGLILMGNGLYVCPGCHSEVIL